jgi:cytoskeletal protein RodZ
MTKALRPARSRGKMPPRSQRQRSRRNDRDEESSAQVGTSTIASPNINSPHAQVGVTTNAAAPAEVPAIAAPAAATGTHAPALPPQIINNSTAAAFSADAFPPNTHT